MTERLPWTRPHPRRRAVITGLGIISPLGVGERRFAQALRSGTSAVGALTRFDASGLPCRLAAEVPAAGFAPSDSGQDRSVRYAILAARQAVDDAGLEPGALDGAGAVIGATKAGPEAFEAACREAWEVDGVVAPSAAWLLRSLPDGAARAVVADLALGGPWTALGAACATGAYCLIRAAELILAGRCDVALAGSTDAPLVPSLFTSYANLAGVVTTHNERGGTAVRPFCRTRDGMVIGEGAGVLVTEELAHARARGAEVYAELAGWAMGGEACHITGPPREPNVPVRVIRQALASARVRASELGYINAHGTATRRNDPYETAAYKEALGDAAWGVPISSTKAMMGHCMVASASLDAAACLIAMRDSFVPPTINHHEADPACDLDYVPNEAREARVDSALSLCLGFGGHVAALVFRRV
jgi:3-oxoacyl-(acyl-carrier-protein) synthase